MPLVLLALVGTAAAQLHAFEPDGWLPVPSAEARLLGGALANVHAFHPPGDPGVRYLVGETSVARLPAEAVGAALDELARDAEVTRRTIETRDGRTVGEATLVYHTGLAGQLRVAAAASIVRAGTDIAVGICSGTPAMVAVCAPRLEWITVEVARPHEGPGFPWRLLAWLFAAAFALGIAIRVARWALRARAMATSEALREGELVTITGVIRAVGEGLVAPLTGRACLAYRARAQVFTASAVPSSLGEPREAGAAPFVITTPRGEIRVEATPELDGAREAIVERSREREVAFLARHGFPRDAHPVTTFDEVAIPAGATIKIRGVVHLERDPGAADERGFRDEAPVVATLVPVPGKPLMILGVW